MVKRQFKTVTRASGILYWDCPTHCGQLHSVTIPVTSPVLISCTCNIEYTVSLVSDLGITTARILIEGDIK